MDINFKERSTSIAEAVFNTIENDILDGKLKSGELLTELKLCELLNVSRTPVREALKRLKQEGMIAESGKGAVVIGITPKDIEDIYSVRLRLEGLACTLCCDNITEEMIEGLRTTVELQEFYVSKGNFENLRNLDSEFHAKIYEYSGSNIISGILSDLHRKVQRFRLSAMKDPERAFAAINEHRAILDALHRRDKALAEELTVLHIKKAYEKLKNSGTV